MAMAAVELFSAGGGPIEFDPTNPPGITLTSNNREPLAFDDTTDQLATLPFEAPPEYAGGDLTLDLIVAMEDVQTSDEVMFEAEVEGIAAAATVLTDNFDTANAGGAQAVSDTAGLRLVYSIALTNKDTWLTGQNKSMRIRIRRDADNGLDTATGDCLVFGVMLREAA